MRLSLRPNEPADHVLVDVVSVAPTPDPAAPRRVAVIRAGGGASPPARPGDEAGADAGGDRVDLLDVRDLPPGGALRRLRGYDLVRVGGQAVDTDRGALPLLAALVPVVDDDVVLAELAAEALAEVTGSTTAALVWDPGAGRLVVGQHEGVPLTASRQRFLAAVLDTDDPIRHVSIHAVPGDAHAVALLDPRVARTSLVADLMLTLFGARLDLVTTRHRNEVLTAELERQEEVAEGAAAARDVLSRGLEHLLHDRAEEVDALVAGHAADAVEKTALSGLADAARTLRPHHTESTGTGALLTLALLYGSPEASQELTRWAARVGGLDLTGRLRAVVVSCTTPGAAPTRRSPDELFARRVRGQLRELGAVAPLLAMLDDAVVAVEAEHSAGDVRVHWEAVAAALTTTDARVQVAAGGAGIWPSGLRNSLQQARWLNSLQHTGSAISDLPDVTVFEHAGLIGEVVGLTRGQDLQGFARRIIAPLLDDDRCGGELLETLHAYLASAGSTSRAAEALHLHASSVKYRLKVIKQLIGRERLEDANARFELELAVRLMMASRQLQAAGQAAA